MEAVASAVTLFCLNLKMLYDCVAVWICRCLQRWCGGLR